MTYGLKAVYGCALAVVLAVASSAQAATVAPPFVNVADESGFGTLVQSLSSPFSTAVYTGVLDSRVYADQVPGASAVTFVMDLQVTSGYVGFSVQDVVLISNILAGQFDLDISEIQAATHGVVLGSTTGPLPVAVQANNNPYPTADTLAYDFGLNEEINAGEAVTLYYTTSGNVDIGVSTASIQDGLTTTANILAAVDDPSSPDLSVPEPASLVLLAGGLVALARRRR